MNVIPYILITFFVLQAKETELLGWNKVVNEAKSKVCVAITDRKQSLVAVNCFSLFSQKKL